MPVTLASDKTPSFTPEVEADRAISEAWAFRAGRAHQQMTIPVLQQVIQNLRTRLLGSYQADWCVIGGCAVMMHLWPWRQDVASSRASPDVDILSSHQPPTRLRRTENLMIGGATYEVDLDDGTTHEVDWITGRKCPQMLALFRQSLVCSTIIKGIPVIDPAYLVACKLAIGTRAWRPKDYTDIRLLLRYTAVSRSEIGEILNTHLEAPLRSEANERFRRIACGGH